jgi:hypothetical protein
VSGNYVWRDNYTVNNSCNTAATSLGRLEPFSTKLEPSFEIGRLNGLPYRDGEAASCLGVVQQYLYRSIYIYILYGHGRSLLKTSYIQLSLGLLGFGGLQLSLHDLLDDLLLLDQEGAHDAGRRE